MQIDDVSTNLIKIALYIDQKHPGFVSELWVDESLNSEIKASLPSEDEIGTLLLETKKLVTELRDQRRQQYVSETLESLIFQIQALDNRTISYADFSRQAFGFTIPRVTTSKLATLQTNIKKLEDQLGQTRQEVYQKQTIPIDAILATFEKYTQEAKSLLPGFITEFPDKGFLLELVTQKPWSAFNSHIAPFTSKLSINTDAQLTDADLNHLAFHEAYGGHHSELSHKDLLLQEGRGEHGLVITFSPQTFISEAIAEGIYSIYQNKKNDLEHQMVWSYNRLTFALQNLATFLYLDDKKSREEIDVELKQYDVTSKTRENILNFSTDPLFSRYAPIYYTAYDFFHQLYESTNQKDQLLKTLFTQPCTPSLLL